MVKVEVIAALFAVTLIALLQGIFQEMLELLPLMLPCLPLQKSYADQPASPLHFPPTVVYPGLCACATTECHPLRFQYVVWYWFGAITVMCVPSVALMHCGILHRFLTPSATSRKPASWGIRMYMGVKC